MKQNSSLFLNSIVVYLRCTDRAAQFLTSPRAQMSIRLPPSASTKAKSQAVKASANSEGWIDTKSKKPAAKRKATAAANSTSRKKGKKGIKSQKMASTRKTGAGAVAKKTSSRGKVAAISISAVTPRATSTEPPQGAEIIDIDDDDDDRSDFNMGDPITTRRAGIEPLARLQFEKARKVALDPLMVDTDEEYEFEG